MGRFRFSIDILDNDDALLVTDINEIIAGALSGAKINVPEAKKRTTKVVLPLGPAGRYHIHAGDGECSGCYECAEDGLGQEVGTEFVTLPSLS